MYNCEQNSILISVYAISFIVRERPAGVVLNHIPLSIATQAGFSANSPAIDRDSIDINVRARGQLRAQLDIQLKATTAADVRADGLHFSLSRKNYDDLRADRMVPAILAVYEMPSNPDDWCKFSDSEAILQRKMWWLSLHGYPEITSASKTVVLPNSQLLTPNSLTALITRVSRGEDI
jgi:hypothetical protein